MTLGAAQIGLMKQHGATGRVPLSERISRQASGGFPGQLLVQALGLRQPLKQAPHRQRSAPPSSSRHVWIIPVEKPSSPIRMITGERRSTERVGLTSVKLSGNRPPTQCRPKKGDSR